MLTPIDIAFVLFVAGCLFLSLYFLSRHRDQRLSSAPEEQATPTTVIDDPTAIAGTDGHAHHCDVIACAIPKPHVCHNQFCWKRRSDDRRLTIRRGAGK